MDTQLLKKSSWRFGHWFGKGNMVAARTEPGRRPGVMKPESGNLPDVWYRCRKASDHAELVVP